MAKMVDYSKSGKFVLESQWVDNLLTVPYMLYTIVGTAIINQYGGRHMYNCGKEKYIRGIWNKRYAQA